MSSRAGKLPFALLIYALSTVVHAGAAGQSASMQCGINLGGKILSFQAAAETKHRKDSRMNHVLGAVQAQPAQFAPVMATDNTAATTSKSDTRLPPKLTLAIIGCSWR